MKWLWFAIPALLGCAAVNPACAPDVVKLAANAPTIAETMGGDMGDIPLAFAGAEGFGAGASGGRGGVVLHVTNLNDSGAGSLRWALEQQTGPRTIVFDVAGTITLHSQILVEHGQVTIAGQTAPGEGITIEGSRIRIKASEVIMRGLHLRPGDGSTGMAYDDRDALMVGTTDFITRNIIIDHNSFAWAVDENVSINGKVQDLSFSNNIVAEGLSRSLHSKGEHSKGLLISNWEGAEGDAARISVIKNLFSDNVQRNPEVRAGQDIEVVNNLIANYGIARAGMAIGGGNGGTLTTMVDVVGNVWMPGQSTPGRDRPLMIQAMAADSRINLSDNLYLGAARNASGHQDQRLIYWATTGALAERVVIDDAVTLNRVTLLDAGAVNAYILANAGAMNGRGRDAVDLRIVAEVANGSSRVINSVADVGGAARMAPAIGPSDSDRDGMPDWFEDLYGLDKRTADNNGDNDRDGFTNVEEYINGIISGFDLGARVTGQALDARVGSVRIDAGALERAAVISGMVAGSGRSIDIGALLAATGQSGVTLAEAVQITAMRGDSYVTIDADGPGAGAARQLIAVVSGAIITVADLSNGGGSTVSTSVTNGTATAPAFQWLVGTTGDDRFTVTNSAQRVRETVGGGTDSVTAEVDYRLDDHVENLSLRGTAVRGEGNDLANKIVGNALANWLSGGDGADRLSGGDGQDRLSGDAGNDWLEGGNGADWLTGGLGVDTLFGGAGVDVFCFAGSDSAGSRSAAGDRINDYCPGDVIMIDGRAIDLTMVAGMITKSSGFAAVYGLADALLDGRNATALIHGTKDSWLFWDSDGDGDIDGSVMLAGVAATRSGWTAPPADMPLV